MSLYHLMFEDEVRMRAFTQAIPRVVRAGDVVLDIGSAMGTFSLLAANAGARRVYGIECDRIIDVAREAAARSSLNDRVTFIEQYSTDVTLPEKADVFFFEDFTSFFLHGSLRTIFADARQRLLQPNARFLPQSADLFLAPFEDADFYSAHDVWGERIESLYGFDFSPLREMALNVATHHTLRPQELLAEPQPIRHIDLATERDFDLQTRRTFTVAREGTLHGVAVWFEMQLAPGVRLSNAPGQPPTIWGQGILPAEYPLAVAPGDLIDVTVDTVRSAAYGTFWNWSLRLVPRSNPTRPWICRQSTFRGSPLPADLREHLRFSEVSAAEPACKSSNVPRFVPHRSGPDCEHDHAA